jgi:hypothetical protein
MKPKIKSNASMMLLLLLLSKVSFGVIAYSDTIIIDGERISIQRDPEYVDIDSLSDSFRKPDINYGFSVMPFVNVLLTHGHISYAGEGTQYLNDFISKGDSWSLGPGFGINVGKELDSHFSASLGFSWNLSTLKNKFVDIETLQDGETYSFESFGKGELSQIINVFIDPGYELDTFPVLLKESNYELQTRDLVLRLKYSLGKPKDDLRWYFQFGTFFRSIHYGNVGPMTMLTGSDSLATWNPDGLKLRTTQWGGSFGGGLSVKFNENNGFNAGLDLWIPAGLLSSRSDLNMSYRSISAFVGYCRYF